MEEKGIYYFHQGTNYRAYELMGAHYHNDYTIFRVYAPHAKIVSVVGEFNNWDTTKNVMKKITNEGLYETIIEGIKEFDCYQYAILTNDNELLFKSDPYGFHCELRPEKSSKVYNLEGFEFSDAKWMKRRIKKQALDQPINIYEVHLGSWRRYENGEFFDYKKLAIELCEYVKKMGYTHIEVMPIAEYPYDPSWGYQVTGYYAITSRYGTPKDFMAFVDICHQNNIGVIVDWVPGHFTKDSHGLIDFDGEATYEPSDEMRKENEGWGTRCFDYGRNEVQSFLVSNAMFLFDKFHIDGIRVDAVASMLYLDYGRSEGKWHKNNLGTNINLEAVAFLQKVNSMVHNYYPGVLMIAEESTSYPKVTEKAIDGGLEFDYKWNMGWMNDTLDYIKTDPLYRKYHHNELTFQMTYIFSEHYILPLSHDEVVHMKGSMINKMPGEYEQKFASLKTYYTYMMTHPGKKLLFMGGEIGQFREWSEARELDWSVLEYPLHRGLQNYVRDLNKLYKKNPALYQNEVNWEGFNWLMVNDADHNVLAYKRIDNKGESLDVIINFAYCDWNDYIMPFDNGEYEVVLASSDKIYGGYTNLKKTTYQVKDGCLRIKLYNSTGIILGKVKNCV